MPARLLEHVDEPLDCDEFVCGDSKEVRDRAIAVLERIPGLRAVDAGPLDSARTLEHMTWLLVRLNKRYKSHNGRFRVLGLTANGVRS
jgi:predicted dinucleotide-binding enzyme